MSKPTAAERATTHPNPDNPHYDAARLREERAGILMVLASEPVRATNRRDVDLVTSGATYEANRDPGTLAYAYATADPDLNVGHTFGVVLAAARERVGACEFCGTLIPRTHYAHCVRPF